GAGGGAPRPPPPGPPPGGRRPHPPPPPPTPPAAPPPPPPADTEIDLRAGLPPLRSAWIAGRGDVEQLLAPTSEYGRQRLADPRLAPLRFAHLRRPRRAKAGANVTQMHYARKGIVTPEMEFVAIRENHARH